MSSGFPHPVKQIQKAISHAIYVKANAIAFFAVANNEGLKSREIFPASQGD